jgi:hypothetical protein
LGALLLVTATGAAEAGDVSFGLGGGVAKPNDFDVQAPYWTAGVRVRRPGLPLQLELEIGRWSKSQQWSVDNEWVSSSDRQSRSDLHLGVNLLVQTGDQVRFWIGGGLGPHFVRSEIASTTAYPGQPEADQAFAIAYSKTKLGIHALAGLEARLSGRFGLFAVARGDLLKEYAQTEIKLYGGLVVDLVKAPPQRPTPD